VQQGQQLINDKYNEKDKIQNTQHAVETRIHSATYNHQQRTWKGRRKRWLVGVACILALANLRSTLVIKVGYT